MEENKYICIWYSWGDVENPVKVPKDKDAWEYMKELVIEEVDVSQEEEPHGCSIWMYPEEDKITLQYHYNNEYCYYKIVENEEEANRFYDDFMENID